MINAGAGETSAMPSTRQILFVLDAMVGQDAVHTVAFRDGVIESGPVRSMVSARWCRPFGAWRYG